MKRVDVRTQRSDTERLNIPDTGGDLLRQPYANIVGLQFSVPQADTTNWYPMLSGLPSNQYTLKRGAGSLDQAGVWTPGIPGLWLCMMQVALAYGVTTNSGFLGYFFDPDAGTSNSGHTIFQQYGGNMTAYPNVLLNVTSTTQRFTWQLRRLVPDSTANTNVTGILTAFPIGGPI